MLELLKIFVCLDGFGLFGLSRLFWMSWFVFYCFVFSTVFSGGIRWFLVVVLHRVGFFLIFFESQFFV